MCPKFQTNSVLKYTKCHISTNLLNFLKLCSLYCQKLFALALTNRRFTEKDRLGGNTVQINCQPKMMYLNITCTHEINLLLSLNANPLLQDCKLVATDLIFVWKIASIPTVCEKSLWNWLILLVDEANKLIRYQQTRRSSTPYLELQDDFDRLFDIWSWKCVEKKVTDRNGCTSKLKFLSSCCRMAILVRSKNKSKIVYRTSRRGSTKKTKENNSASRKP